MSKNTQQAGGEANQQALRFVNLSCYEKKEKHIPLSMQVRELITTLWFVFCKMIQPTLVRLYMVP